MAMATPAIFPVPILEAADIQKAWKDEIPFFPPLISVSSVNNPIL